MRLSFRVEVRGRLRCWSSPSILFEALSFLSVTSVYHRLPSPRTWTRRGSQPVGFEPFDNLCLKSIYVIIRNSSKITVMN